MTGLPPGWIETKIGSIARIETGSTPPKGDAAFYGPELPFYKLGDLDKLDVPSEEFAPRVPRLPTSSAPSRATSPKPANGSTTCPGRAATRRRQSMRPKASAGSAMRVKRNGRGGGGHGRIRTCRAALIGSHLLPWWSIRQRTAACSRLVL